ncbi:MAG: hypothetical protein GF416_09070 [Candidatus Altiarchaeales archaeon]|nr:hypothetical protein [Candidatus Altiarchaeales archaeon]MBD3417269.1 hypothetical protein [Candidatus Altiarchaeales archaeon]
MPDTEEKSDIDLIPTADIALKSESQIIVLVMPEEEYIERLMTVVSDLSTLDHGKICYVSLNRPYESLKRILDRVGIDSSNFFFIDAITKTAKIPDKSDNCEYISSPGALTELSVAISNSMEHRDFKFIVFDSLSTLLVYESDTTIAKFVHFLMAKVRVAECSAVFTCLKQDASSILVKDINMFADKVIDLERWNIRKG